MNIEITEELNQRLITHSVGFAVTHEQVIKKLLDHYEAKDNLDKPTINFLPNEAEFTQNLLRQKSAWKELHFDDGTVKVEEWVAKQFKETSSIKSNIWSGPLRDWKNKKIKMLVLSVEKPEPPQTSTDTTVEIKIGKFVKSHINEITYLCVMNSNHLQNLINPEWCHEKLGINFPLLMKPDVIKDKKLHQRYWTAEHTIKVRQYRFCSQFGGGTLVGGKTLSEQHGLKFLHYLNEYDLLLPEFKNRNIKFIVKKT